MKSNLAFSRNDVSSILPGIYPDIPNETYHHGPKWRDILGSSQLKQLQKSPAHLQHCQTSESVNSPAKELGTLVHHALLEPANYLESVIVMPEIDRRTKEGKEIFARFQAEAAGKSVITKEQAETIQKITESVAKSETASSLLTYGAAEQSFVWEDPVYGFLCKCRTDWFRYDDIIVDVKTTSTGADPVNFSKACANYGYDISAAWYERGVFEKTGKKPSYLFMAIETTPPYGVAVYLPNIIFMEVGRKKIEKLTALYAKCISENEWPCYPDKVQDLTLPTWAAF